MRECECECKRNSTSIFWMSNAVLDQRTSHPHGSKTETNKNATKKNFYVYFVVLVAFGAVSTTKPHSYKLNTQH